MHRIAVPASRKLDAQLHAQIMRWQETLVTTEQFDIAQAGTGRTGQFQWRAGVVLAIGAVVTDYIRDLQANVPPRVGCITHARGEVAILCLVLELVTNGHD